MEQIIIKFREGKYLHEIWHQIEGFESYDVSNMGRVRKIEDSKTIEIKPIPQDNRFGCVYLYKGIEKKECKIVQLVVKYFHPEYTEGCKIKYKDGNALNRVITNLKIRKKHKPDQKLPSKKNMYLRYDCETRADTINRTTNQEDHTLSGMDIYNSLLRTNFHCFYCNCKLTRGNYHIDHVIPLSKGGLNLYNNIVSTCNVCNLMKGANSLNHFMIKISEIYIYQKSVENEFII